MFNPWVVKILWRREWQSIQYSCLGNPMDREDWWATVYGDAESLTRLSNWPHTPSTGPFSLAHSWSTFLTILCFFFFFCSLQIYSPIFSLSFWLPFHFSEKIKESEEKCHKFPPPHPPIFLYLISVTMDIISPFSVKEIPACCYTIILFWPPTFLYRYSSIYLLTFTQNSLRYWLESL